MKGNDIGDEGCKELAIGIEFNSSIKSLNLEENLIEHIPSVFLKIPNLQIWNQSTWKQQVTLKYPPQEVVDKGIEEIRRFYKENETPTTTHSQKRQKI